MATSGPAEFAKLHTPLYRVIEQDLRSRIQSGKWAAGAMLPSRKSLAKEYGVDMRTIQRAIGDLLADGSLQAHGGRGTFVPTSVDGETAETRVAYKTIVIIAEQSFNPVPSWPAMIHAIHEGLRKHIEDCRIITINTSDKTPEAIVHHERDALKMAQSDHLAGVVMFHSGGSDTLGDIQRLQASDIPIVFIDRLPFEHGCDFVGIDNRFASREGIEYLLSIGHQRIAFVAPDEEVTTINDRLNGYLDAFAGAGLEPPADLIFRLSPAKSLAREGLRSEIERVVSEFSKMSNPPTAMFAVNDFLAEFLLIVLEEKGIKVPDDISVVGFDDVERFLPQKARLTTVRQPFEAIGERAASMLWWRMSHPESNAGAYQHVMLPTRLIVRDTTKPRL